jgi:hypothetical protein
MRISHTLNNNITNNYKTELTMTEDAPNATDHDDDSQRIASSYSYDLPNQEPNQNDDDVSFVPPNLEYQVQRNTNFDKFTRFVKEWEDRMMPASSSWPLSNTNTNTNKANTNVSFVPSSILNAVHEVTRFIEDDLTNQLHKCSEDSCLPPGLLTPFDRIENILDELTMFMKEDEIKPIRMRERRRRNECEKLYYLKAMKAIYAPPLNQQSEAKASSYDDATTLINKTELMDRTPQAIKSKVKSTSIRDRLSDQTPKAIKSKVQSTNVRDLNFDRDNPSSSVLSLSSYNDTKLQQQSSNDINLQPSLNKNVNVSSIKSPLLVSERTASITLQPLLNCNNNNDNNNDTVSITLQPLSNCNNKNNYNNKVSIINKAPATGMKSKFLRTNHTGTTKYAATDNHVTGKPTVLKPWKFSSTRLKISLAHEEASTAIPEFLSTRSKISNTHESSRTGSKIVIPNVSKSSKFSSTSFAHEEASSRTPVTSRTTCKVNEVTHTMISKIPEMIHTGTTKYAATVKHGSMGTDKGIIKVKCATTATTKYDATSTQSNISVAHEEASTATPKVLTSSELSSARPKISITHEEASTAISNDVLKSPALSSARSKISNAHESKYTGMNTKYAITATEQSSYVPNPISNDNPVNNNKIFCSQYLQTVLKITNNNNKHDTFNNIQLSLLLYQFIPTHPFIEYLQPEPEPPPLNSYLILFLFFYFYFIHWI